MNNITGLQEQETPRKILRLTTPCGYWYKQLMLTKPKDITLSGEKQKEH
jgi:hypothetical protein